MLIRANQPNWPLFGWFMAEIKIYVQSICVLAIVSLIASAIVVFVELSSVGIVFLTVVSSIMVVLFLLGCVGLVYQREKQKVDIYFKEIAEIKTEVENMRLDLGDLRNKQKEISEIVNRILVAEAARHPYTELSSVLPNWFSGMFLPRSKFFADEPVQREILH